MSSRGRGRSREPRPSIAIADVFESSESDEHSSGDGSEHMVDLKDSPDAMLGSTQHMLNATQHIQWNDSLTSSMYTDRETMLGDSMFGDTLHTTGEAATTTILDSVYTTGDETEYTVSSAIDDTLHTTGEETQYTASSMIGDSINTTGEETQYTASSAIDDTLHTMGEETQYTASSMIGDSINTTGEETQYETEGSSFASLSDDDISEECMSSDSESIDSDFDDEKENGNEKIDNNADNDDNYIDNGRGSAESENDERNNDDDDYEGEDDDSTNGREHEQEKSDDEDNENQDLDVESGERRKSYANPGLNMSAYPYCLNNVHQDESSNHSENHDNSDEFDDEDEIVTELHATEASKRKEFKEHTSLSIALFGSFGSKTKKTTPRKSTAERKRMEYSNRDDDNSGRGGDGGVLQGKYKWHITGGGILLIIIIAAGIAVLFLLKGSGEDAIENTPKQIDPLTTTSLPVTFFAVIEALGGNGVNIESVENDFSEAFSVLVPQILKETSNDATTTRSLSAKTRIVFTDGRQRNLEAITVKLPVAVDAVQTVCPVVVENPNKLMCVDIIANIILNSNFDVYSECIDFIFAMENAIEYGRLQESVHDTGSDLDFTAIIQQSNADVCGTPLPTITPPSSPTVSLVSPPPTKSSCFDKEEECEDWADQNQCYLNSEYMELFCAKSCGLCESDPVVSSCFDREKKCEEWANRVPSECDENPKWMEFHCTKSCGFCEFDSTLVCLDREKQCEEWANREPSECDTNVEYMKFHCAKSCGLCELHSADACFDREDKCEEWANREPSECNTNEEYMKFHCNKSCGLCELKSVSVCADKEERCKEWANSEPSECDTNVEYMKFHCSKSCGLC